MGLQKSVYMVACNSFFLDSTTLTVFPHLQVKTKRLRQGLIAWIGVKYSQMMTVGTIHYCQTKP